MSKHRRNQPVTRREVLRIVQRARDEILSAVVYAGPWPERFRGKTITYDLGAHNAATAYQDAMEAVKRDKNSG